MTSPEASPTRKLTTIGRFNTEKGILQVDGSRERFDNEGGSDAGSERQSLATISVHSGSKEVDGVDSAPYGSNFWHTEANEGDKDQHGTAMDIHEDLEEETPLVPPSPAKGIRGFPFPSQSPEDSSQSSRKTWKLREPSKLLRYREQTTSNRHARIIKSGIASPDRFISSRANTPTKDACIIQSLSRGGIDRHRQHGLHGFECDPFGPSPRLRVPTVDRLPMATTMPRLSRSTRRRTSVVPDARGIQQRSASTGAVWNVGGLLVTEGIASVPNGRGGRVTSGSSAAHYFADFLRRDSVTENETTHSRRLAVAMDCSPARSLLQHSGPLSPTRHQAQSTTPGVQRSIFKDGRWNNEGRLTTTDPTRKKPRGISTIPFRVLDAPALRDDYYCSLLAYSPTVQCLAVGLGAHVYLWAESRDAMTIPDSLTAPYGSAHVTSLSFSSNDGQSAILAIGRADGRITLWSPLDQDPRFDSEQPAPVSCVLFRPTTACRPSIRDSIATSLTEELLVGDEAGCVYYYSVEWPSQDQRDLFDWHGSMTLLARVSCHTQQVCGLAWSPGGDYLATGGNDNQIFLFNRKSLLTPASQRPGHSTASINVRNGTDDPTESSTVSGQGDVLAITPGREKHIFALNAAVKAIAFAPWQPSLLAAGGGSNDRCIHFFHTLSGAPLATIDCYAQITSLVWSPSRREIAATFGFAQPEHPYRVAVFAWPRGDLLVAIPWWSEERALYAILYPRGPTSGVHKASRPARMDAEGRPWYARRTQEEGCLVVATSDASIKFHEIWAERGNSRKAGTRKDGHHRGGVSAVPGVLGGSQILEGECSSELERREAIR